MYLKKAQFAHTIELFINFFVWKAELQLELGIRNSGVILCFLGHLAWITCLCLRIWSDNSASSAHRHTTGSLVLKQKNWHSLLS